jgi:hypothetical protein
MIGWIINCFCYAILFHCTLKKTCLLCCIQLTEEAKAHMQLVCAQIYRPRLFHGRMHGKSLYLIRKRLLQDRSWFWPERCSRNSTTLGMRNICHLSMARPPQSKLKRRQDEQILASARRSQSTKVIKNNSCTVKKVCYQIRINWQQ